MDIVTPGFEPEYQRIVVLLQSGQDSNLYEWMPLMVSYVALWNVHTLNPNVLQLFLILTS